MVHDNFPDRLRLWRGTVLATVAHAIGVAANPLFSYELSWDGINYSRQNSQGTRGTVTFAQGATVAVFRDESSVRIPGRSSNEYDLNWFFRGMPEDLMLLAHREALQYMLDEYEGKESPTITAAFWGDTNILTSAEPWAEVFSHGAHLLRTELTEVEAAMSEWAGYHDMSEVQSDLLRALYTRRIQELDLEIVIGKQEYAVLTSEGADGIEESRELLAAIGIKFPK